jgi:hypothetical protein
VLKVKLSSRRALFNEKLARMSFPSACANEIAICTRDAAKQILKNITHPVLLLRAMSKSANAH